MLDSCKTKRKPENISTAKETSRLRKMILSVFIILLFGGIRYPFAYAGAFTNLKEGIKLFKSAEEIEKGVRIRKMINFVTQLEMFYAVNKGTYSANLGDLLHNYKFMAKEDKIETVEIERLLKGEDEDWSLSITVLEKKFEISALRKSGKYKGYRIVCNTGTMHYLDNHNQLIEGYPY